MKIKILLFVLGIMLVLALATAKFYNGLNAGVAWSWGGFEWRGSPGVFLCVDQC